MKKRSGTRPDVEELLKPLKGFQRKTVDYVFERMYRANNPTTRFLVADEVGLGKTMIARGIIAKAIEDMWDRVGRIDIVYICSNVAIAQQNLAKLAVGEAANHALATRLTLLPQKLQGLDEHKVNFVSFTPGTSFDLKSRGGMVSERVVLHTLLSGVMDVGAGVRNLLQGNVMKSTWRRMLRQESQEELDATLVKAFRKAFRDKSQKDLRRRLRKAIDMFGRYRDEWPAEHRHVRNRIIGELRMLLARTSVDKLEPDLIILDEFQRFRHLLHDDDEMASLARSMWNYKTPEGDRARVLLLSATPYRMYSTDFDNADDDHYRDFIDTTRFLMNEDEPRVQRFQADLRRYRNAIHAALHGDSEKIVAARDAVQEQLRTVMVRTERVAETTKRDAMMLETPSPAEVQVSDLQQWVFLDKLSRAVDDRDPVELWKSAPYLPQFMRNYQLKRKLEGRLEDPDVVQLFKDHGDALLDQQVVSKFGRVDPANARLRAVVQDLLGQDQWQLLWVPPTLPYWPLQGAFARNNKFTKALIFSAWHVVPDVVSAVLSYEADRLMLGDGLDEGLNYDNLHKKHRGLLRFSISEGRNTGMTALALQYPSLTLADEACPLSMWAAGEADRQAAVRDRVAALLSELDDPEGRVDERWYWAAPALLDQRRGVGAEFLAEWKLEQPEDRDREEQLDTDGAGGDDRGFSAHVALLRAVLAGEEKLGRKPDDLVEVVTELALGAPGILAARSLRPAEASSTTRQQAAALVAEGFRTLFNQPTAMAVVRRLAPGIPYWRACLHYGIAGCLQAVLDEHFHQLWEQRVWSKTSGDEAALSVAKSMGYAASIKTSRIQADTFKPNGTSVEMGKLRLRTSFALRYGKVVGDQDSVVAREGAVREAFNSPYRPFVLASTSIGQEGLDFHPWCHAIVHWNLPGNPVDLEQREGRVHRYEGHAVRRNVALKVGERTVREGWKTGQDPWRVMFELAAEDRAAGESDLRPWWIFDGESAVERRVPLIWFSKEVEKLRRLKRELVAYRLAFGQPRQQELVSAVVRGAVGLGKVDGWVLDLRP